MILTSIVVNVLILFGYAIFQFINNNILGGVVFVIIAVAFAAIAYSSQEKIPLARALLKAVTKVIAQFPATMFAGFAAMVVTAGFFVWWAATVVGLYIWLERTTKTEYASVSGSSLVGLYFYMVFFLYWTNQVLCNTVTLTVSGLFGEFYFLGIANTAGEVTLSGKNPTLRSAKRALTTSFGSNCFGSLFIAIVKAIVAYIRSCCCCCACCGFVFTQSIQYVSNYAFVYCSVYGTDYCTSARDTKDLFVARGFSAILNDSIINSVLFMGSIISGGLAGVVTGAVGN